MINRDVTFDEASILKTSLVGKVSFSYEKEKYVSKVVVQTKVTHSLGLSGINSSLNFEEDK